MAIKMGSIMFYMFFSRLVVHIASPMGRSQYAVSL